MAEHRSSVKLPDAIKTSNGGSFDVFSDLAWKAVGWPKNIPPGMDRNAYYRDKLPGFLKAARQFLCAVAEAKIPETIGTTYFSSSSADTAGSFVLKAVPFLQGQPNPQAVGFDKTNTVQGDGTVPLEIAVNAINANRATQHLFPREKHEYLLNSSDFKTTVWWIYRRAQAAATERLLQTAEYQERLQRVHEQFGSNIYAILPPEENAAQLFPHVVAFNQALMQRRGVTPADYPWSDRIIRR